MVSTMIWQSMVATVVGLRQKEQRRFSAAGCRMRSGAQGCTHYQNIVLKLKHTLRTSLSISWQSSLSAVFAPHPTRSKYRVSLLQSLLSQGKHSSSPTPYSFSIMTASSMFHLDSLTKIDITTSSISLSISILAAALRVLQTGRRDASGDGRAMARKIGSTLGRVRRWQSEYTLEQREGLQFASSLERSLRACLSLIQQ